MDSKNKVSAALRQLRRSHKRIRDEFAHLSDSLIRKLLTEAYSPQLREQIKEYGDGQRLYSYPRSINSLESIDAVVLIARTSPKLGPDSNLDRSTPLHKIKHWRTAMPISPNLGSCRLHFMTWEQNCGVHGVDDQHALRNYRLLIAHNHELKSMFDEEKEAGTRFILTLEQWLRDRRKPMVVITNSIRKNFDEPILSLIHNPDVKHIKTGLRSRNSKLMTLIGEVLK